MLEKIIKYEIKMSVPSSQVSTHQKKFENLLHKAINTGQGMKQTNVITRTSYNYPLSDSLLTSFVTSQTLRVCSVVPFLVLFYTHLIPFSKTLISMYNIPIFKKPHI